MECTSRKVGGRTGNALNSLPLVICEQAPHLLEASFLMRAFEVAQSLPAMHKLVLASVHEQCRLLQALLNPAQIHAWRPMG